MVIRHPFTRSELVNPTTPEEREGHRQQPVFGAVSTDHMVTARFEQGEWSDLHLGPCEDLHLHPSTLALHYGQSIFEALKAFPRPGGEVGLFRPEMNARRFDASARRLAMPTLPAGVFVDACVLLADADREWVPQERGGALYLRPLMFGVEPHLSVRPASAYQFLVIASPVAAYFGPKVEPIIVAVEHRDIRAARGGTGGVKFAGNYAGGFAAHAQAIERGAHQVLWLDAIEQRWIEELNAMNVMIVRREANQTSLITPPLSGTILPGVTRDSILAIASVDHVEEHPIAIDELLADIRSGTITEMFACGTAAAVVPIGALIEHTSTYAVGDGREGPVTTRIREQLFAIQYGEVPDERQWCVQVPRGASIN